jgi:hypothetical protein
MFRLAHMMRPRNGRFLRMGVSRGRCDGSTFERYIGDVAAAEFAKNLKAPRATELIVQRELAVELSS